MVNMCVAFTNSSINGHEIKTTSRHFASKTAIAASRKGGRQFGCTKLCLPMLVLSHAYGFAALFSLIVKRWRQQLT